MGRDTPASFINSKNIQLDSFQVNFLLNGEKHQSCTKAAGNALPNGPTIGQENFGELIPSVMNPFLTVIR